MSSLKSANPPEQRAPSHPPPAQTDPIAPPSSPVSMAREIQLLYEEHTLLRSGPFDVIACHQADAPSCIDEIGRLRELSFRDVGEGTGRPRDLDPYDRHYLHLFVWNREDRAIVGSYRLRGTDEIQTPEELYIHELFELCPDFLSRVGPAIELGRAFVRSEYQRSYAPLMLLWKGIGALLMRSPRYRFFFGALSISKDFQPLSRELMLDFLAGRRAPEPLREGVRARRPVTWGSMARAWKRSEPAANPEMSELASAIDELEGGQMHLPVLLRQYVRLGAKALDFSVDPAFGDAIDAFVLVDVPKAPRELLERYLTPEGARSYLNWGSATERPGSVAPVPPSPWPA